MNKISLRERNLKIVNAFFDRLEAMEINSFIELIDDNCVQKMPYSPEWFIKELNGKEAIYKQFKSLPEVFESMRYDKIIEPLLDENKFLARFTGQIKRKDGTIYQNNYINLFTLRNGKIIEIIEYFDPIILEKGFKPKN